MDEQGSLSSYGLVEVRTSHGFASVCGLNQGAANAICEAMGYPGGSIYPHSCSSVGGKNMCGSKGLPVALQNLRCEGAEDSLSQCQWEEPDKSCLDHSKDSIVRCNSSSGESEGSLRLVAEDGSLNSGVGRLEVLLHENWTPVCRDGFTQGSASVACKSMGFSGAGAGPFGCEGYGKKWCGTLAPELQLTCDGSEKDISACRGRAGSDVFCSPADSVVLQCRGAVHPKSVVTSSSKSSKSSKSSNIKSLKSLDSFEPLESSASLIGPLWRRRRGHHGHLFL